MAERPDLFIGITSWNSALFLPFCLQAVRATTAAIATEVVVLDNCSEDGSADIARGFGTTVLEERCSQAVALNRLAAVSRAPYTLLMHADTILLNPSWFDICRSKLAGPVVLVSPEDIGCGPLTRPFGLGKPESSFLLFDTAALKRLRELRWRRRWRMPIPERVVDFYGEHITHSLPRVMAASGFDWCPMTVHWSDRVEAPIFQPDDEPDVWSDELPFLRYGLGNFYSLDGVITHYHNWYDRIALPAGNGAVPGAVRGQTGFPPDYIKAYTAAFLRDYAAGCVVIPPALATDRQPVAL